MNGSFALGILSALAPRSRWPEGGGRSVKLVQRLARRLGELLLALAIPAALGAPRKWS
jgi:hypothetical protein